LCELHRPKNIHTVIFPRIALREPKPGSSVNAGARGPLASRIIYHLRRVQYLPLARLLSPPLGPNCTTSQSMGEGLSAGTKSFRAKSDYRI